MSFSTTFEMDPKVQSGLTKMMVNYCKDTVRSLSLKFGFDLSDAFEHLSLDETQCITKEKKPKKILISRKSVTPSIPLPFCGVKMEEWCNGLKLNHGLYTQCTSAKIDEGAYCKTCQKQVDNKQIPTYGTIDERMTGDPMKYHDPQGKSVVSYGNVMKKMQLDREMVIAEATKLNWTIPEEQFQVMTAKRGRPKKTVDAIVQDTDDETPNTPLAPKKRGRPKKTKKVVATNIGDDLIATLVAQAKAEESAAESAQESAQESVQESVQEVLQEQAQEPVQEQVIKKKRGRPSKAELSARKAQEEVKVATPKENIVINKKRGRPSNAELAARKAEIEEHVNVPALQITPDVQKSESKEELQIEEVDDDDAVYDAETENEEDDVPVEKFEHDGTIYLKGEDGVLYDMETQDPIGEWNENTKAVEVYKFNEI